jgi:hypothetical protein
MWNYLPILSEAFAGTTVIKLGRPAALMHHLKSFVISFIFFTLPLISNAIQDTDTIKGTSATLVSFGFIVQISYPYEK